MKKYVGLLFALVILCQPIQADAHERQCPQTIEVTQQEAVELMQIASAEALNQGIDGMRYVMSVVINRVNSPDYPNDIHSVIYQPHQFYTAGMAKAEITPEVHMALALLEMGNLTPEIVAFETVQSDALDVYYLEAFTSGNHKFYTVKH